MTTGLEFLGQLADNLQTAAVVLYAFVLMDNHIHLLVRAPRANLSRFMQRLLTAYARSTPASSTAGRAINSKGDSRRNSFRTTFTSAP